MGCGCGGKGQVSARASRSTIYQVLVQGQVVSEHPTLPDARSAAVTAGGRVKVTSKAT